jgi:hypothetical protein
MSRMQEVAKRNPINATASYVVAAGTEYTYTPKMLVEESDTPFPMRATLPMCPEFRNLTGVRCGRLVVIGLKAESQNGKAGWVCRCDCGRYVIRRSKVLTNPKNNDRCQRCRHYDRQRDKEEWLRLGFNRRNGGTAK